MFRVPAFAAAAAGEDLPPTVPCLPRLPDDIKSAIWYGIRCSEYWQDVPSLLFGEKGWVLGALRKCARAYLVPCAVRPPLLLLLDVAAQRQNLSLPAVVTHLPFSAAGARALELPGVAFQKTFIFQQMKTVEESEVDSDDWKQWLSLCNCIVPTATEKAQKLLSLPASMLDGAGNLQWFPSWGNLFPREALVSAKWLAHRITIVAKKDSCTANIIPEVQRTYGQMYAQSPSVLRVCTLAPASTADAEFLSKLPGVARVILESSEKVFFPPSEDRASKRTSNKTDLTVADNRLVVIRDMFGEPIPKEAATLIVQALGLSKVRISALEFSGFCGTAEEAKSLHECVVASRFVVGHRASM